MRITALCFPFFLSLIAPAWADEIPQTDAVTGATENGDAVSVAPADEYQDTAEKLPAWEILIYGTVFPVCGSAVPSPFR